MATAKRGPNSPIFRWLNDSWDHAAPPREAKKIIAHHLRGRYAHALGCMAAGLCGGVLMALLQMGIAASNGLDIRTPFYLIDNLFSDFLSISFGATSAASIGLTMHLLLSAGFGAFFSVLLRIYANENSKLDAFFGGLAYGVLIWAFTNYGIIMRWSDSSLEQKLSTPPNAWFFAHLLFGATLTLAPVFTAAIRRNSERPFNRSTPFQPKSRAA